MNPERQKAQEELDDLLREAGMVPLAEKAAEAEVARLRNRYVELLGGWGNTGGLIEDARKKLRLAGLPVYPTEQGYGEGRVILNVDKRWITLVKGSYEAKFDKNTGQRKGTRTAYDKIDAKVAIDLWQKYLETEKTYE